MSRIYIGDLGSHIGNEVLISGWIDVRRDQGKMVFFDFRDMSGKVQGVVLPGSAAIEVAKICRPEWVVSVKGKVNPRPERAIQKDKQNGNLELEVLEIEILNQAETPVFDIGTDTRVVNEEVRLENRYIDLRSERLQSNIRNRHKVIKFVRDYLDKEKFIEKGSLLGKGIRLLVDGTLVEEVEQVIAQDIQSTLDRNKKSASILRRAADIAPAMGLIGTLIGLVQMLSSLDNPSSIGPFMAVALLTTLYGALFAYMVLTPIASKIERNSDEQLLLNKIYLISIACIGKQETPRKLERLINTVLPPSKKLKTFKEE